MLDCIGERHLLHTQRLCTPFLLYLLLLRLENLPGAFDMYCVWQYFRDMYRLLCAADTSRAKGIVENTTGRKGPMYLFIATPGGLKGRFEQRILPVQGRDPFRKLFHLLVSRSLPLLP